MASIVEVSIVLYDVPFVALHVAEMDMLATTIIDRIRSKRAGTVCNLTG